MLIPLWDEPHNRRVPWMTYSLVGVNLVLFFYTFLGLGLADYGRWTVPRYGLVVQGFEIHMLVTHMFLHGGWGHVAGNMFFLGFFGRNVERRIGGGAFLLVYLLVGVSAGALQMGWVLFSGRGLDVPMVGASGAVFGVLGLYTAIFGPREVRLLMPRIRVVGWQRFPIGWTDTYLAAYWLGFVYLVWNILDGVFLERLTGIAHWAHVGGFVGGLVVGWTYHACGFRGRPAEPLIRLRPRIEDEAFEELAYIPDPDDGAAAPPGARPIHRPRGAPGVLRLPARRREPREAIQTRLILPTAADHAVVLCYEERLEPAILAELTRASEGAHGSRHGRWAARGVLNRTLTREGAFFVRERLRTLGYEAVVVPALRLLPLADPRIVARCVFAHGHLDVVEPCGRIDVLRAEDFLFLSAGRTAGAAGAPYFVDLFGDEPLSRWRFNRSNFDFVASGIGRRLSDHQRVQALIEAFRAAYPGLPLATSALELLRGGRPERYTFRGIREYEHYNDWVLQILGLERTSRTSPGGM